MTPFESRCLDAFSGWLRSLAEDARAVSGVLEQGGPETSRVAAASALTYLFKSLDLIADGLEEIGFLDDAFVLRVAAAGVPEADRASDPSGTLTRLAEDAAILDEFLGPAYGMLVEYVAGLRESSARGRSVASVLAEPAELAELLREVRGWADGYDAPAFARDARNLVKLRSFLAARLASA